MCFGRAVVCRLTICSETTHKRFARCAFSTKVLPEAIWQFAQYCPVMPATLGLAASSAWVAAAREGDRMNSRAADNAIFSGRPAFLLRPVPRDEAN